MPCSSNQQTTNKQWIINRFPFCVCVFRSHLLSDCYIRDEFAFTEIPCFRYWWFLHVITGTPSHAPLRAPKVCSTMAWSKHRQTGTNSAWSGSRGNCQGRAFSWMLLFILFPIEPFTSFGRNIMALIFKLRTVVFCVNRNKTKDYFEVQGLLQYSVTCILHA